MSVIKAPYNFVPFNKEVVSPHWIDRISHDIPFEDGLSGSIELKLTAKSPIFVRDGIGQAEAKRIYHNNSQQKAHTFSRFGDQYFIPGTSIKGMIRNVLEILSFGSMVNKVNDNKYALRDLSGAMKDIYLKDFKPDKIHCGWLRKLPDGTYSLSDCGLPGRISHKDIDKEFKTNMSSYFSVGGAFQPKNDREKSAQNKYRIFGNNNLNHMFSFVREDVGNRQIYTIDNHGNKSGKLVFTGQPGFRQQRNGRWSGHHLEFIFFTDQVTEHIVPEIVFNDFLFAYFEHDRTKWSEDWKVWRNNLERGDSIPVFFHKDESNNVKSLGLSYLYKLPYTNSVVDSISYYQDRNKLDLSDAIFGYTGKNNSLKGRVHIGHAFSPNGEEDNEVKEVLAGPKASYYPNYIRQEVNGAGAVNRYKTFMDEGAEVAGWKRYPVNQRVESNPPPSNADSEKMLTKFIPLKAGAEFNFTINYHNLRPVELGALLSALTFHGADNTYHSIGMAKPLGYGKVSLSILNSDEVDVPKYLGIFETYMNVQLNKEIPTWHTTEQVTELITMAQEQTGADLTYMTLGEHVLAKNDKDRDKKNRKPREALRKYSNIVSKSTSIPSHCDAGEIAKMKAFCSKEVEGHLVQDNIDEVVAMTRKVAKGELEQLWNARKIQLIEELVLKQEFAAQSERLAKQAIEEAERARKKEENQEQIQALGLDLSDVLDDDKKAFDKLKKIVDSYGSAYHNLNDKQLKQKFPDGYLPDRDQVVLGEKLLGIYNNRSIKEKENWKKEYNRNAILKKIAEWIGEEKAKNMDFE